MNVNQALECLSKKKKSKVWHDPGSVPVYGVNFCFLSIHYKVEPVRI